MGGGRKEVGNQLRFLLLISTISLSPLVNSVIGGTSIRELRKNGQMKWHISQSPSLSRGRSLSDPKLNSLNSTRSARQTPEIPALYSAPKIPTPEIPALYSAPEINPESQNEVDSASSADQGRATTEVSVEEMDEEEETSSEDYQYGVPTEKYPSPNDSNQEEESFSEHPTDSPSATSRTNEADPQSDYNDPTEDSYGLGRANNNGADEPNPQYGPPSSTSSRREPNPQYGPPSPSSQQEPNSGYLPPASLSSSPSDRSPNGQGKEEKGDKNGNGSPYPGNNQPKDQNQMENTVQPMSQTEQYFDDDEETDPESFYLPPSHTNQLEQPQQSQGDNGASSQYGGDFDQYQQPPNPNYKTLPPENNGNDVESSPVSGGQSPPNFEERPHDLSKQRSNPFPSQAPQSQRESQQQGQDFGKGASSKPSSFYGPPGVNHLGSENSEDEMEGLNEKIVDSELLQRVHQIIEDHENQQKLLLEGSQRNNEKSSSFGYSSGSGSPPSQDYTGNELNGPTGFSSPGSSYSGYNSNSPTPTDYNSYGAGGNGGGNVAVPSTFYGPPSFSPSYPDSNSLYQQGTPNGNGEGSSQSPQTGGAYKGVAGSGGRDSSRKDANGNRSGSASSSQSAAGYNSSGRQEGNDNEPKRSSADVEYQKAILSTSFTESQPASQSQSEGYDGSSPFQSADNNGSAPRSGYPSDNRLNSFAGPGQEYLPPPPNNGKQQQRGNDQQNEGYGRSFSSGDYAAQNQNGGGTTAGERNSFGVKVRAGIMVGDDRQATKSSSLSPGYLPPAGTPASASRQQQGHADPREFYTPPNDSSSSGASKGSESFPSKLSPAQRGGSGQQQQQFFPSFSQSPGSDPAVWSRGQASPEPQTSYGPPPSFNGASKTPFHPLGPSDNNNNNGANSLSPYGAGFQAQNQIKYSNGLGAKSSVGSNVNNENNQQGSQSPRQLYPVPQRSTTSAPATGTANMAVAAPRPIYGVPLAPVITLDSGGNMLGYSLGGNDGSSASWAGGQAAAPNANYLPPPSSTQYNPAPAQPSGVGQDLSSSFPSQLPSTNEAIYGILANNPSSSASSTYLSIQGPNGNSNNHIYNINHNDYGGGSGSSSSGSLSPGGSIMLSHAPNYGDYDHSSVIPGLSNPFALPIYDYSPESVQQLLQNDLRAGASTSASSVVVPLEQFLEQLPLAHNMPPLSMDNLPAIIYGTDQGGFRLARRAVSKQASVSSVSSPRQRSVKTGSRASNSDTQRKSPRG